MFDNAQDTLLFLGIALATIGLIGGAVHYYRNGRLVLKNYSTIREAAKVEAVPYTVIQGWVRREYVRSIRVGQGGCHRLSGEQGMLMYHNVVHDLDVSSLAQLWRDNNPAKPKYLTSSQYVRYNRKMKGHAKS
tara:strand:- start:194 stop:592 length:399 start_codon:yes stop_codon:yes gene_type:complete